MAPIDTGDPGDAQVRMHPDEIAIDVGLVRRLLADQFPDLAALPVTMVRSTGTACAIVRIGDDRCVRLSRLERWTTGLTREVQWLPKLAPQLPLAIPPVIAVGRPTEDFALPWAIYGWLDGEPWLDQPIDQVAAATTLAGFVAAMRRIDPAGAPATGRAPLRDLDEATRAAIDASTDIDRDAAHNAWERAVALPPWYRAPVWIHNDLLRPNLLLRDDHIAAVLDFGSCGIGDPAADIVPAWSVFTATGRSTFRAALRVDDPTWERARGYALHQAALIIPYYGQTNPGLVAAARRTITQVLSDISPSST
jgi:aminoglycoside phosphotransferase (APT) family kinase protein